MTDMKPTPGPWFAERSFEKNVGLLIRSSFGIGDGGIGPVIAEVDPLPEQEANAFLIIRLANLYFAGTARAEKRTADVIAQGDMPADPDYGLTENEVAAARMMNALMDENAELLEALERIAQIERDKCENADAEMLFMLLDNKVEIAIAAIAKAKGMKP